MTTRHVEAVTIVDAAPEALFAHVDDHSRFSSHMNQSSWMMAGSRMAVELDSAQGRAVGSHIRLTGRLLGVGRMAVRGRVRAVVREPDGARSGVAL